MNPFEIHSIVSVMLRSFRRIIIPMKPRPLEHEVWSRWESLHHDRPMPLLTIVADDGALGGFLDSSTARATVVPVRQCSTPSLIRDFPET